VPLTAFPDDASVRVMTDSYSIIRGTDINKMNRRSSASAVTCHFQERVIGIPPAAAITEAARCESCLVSRERYAPRWRRRNAIIVFSSSSR
jgi:hypothetical protein